MIKVIKRESTHCSGYSRLNRGESLREGLHEVCVRVGGRAGVLNVTTKFSRMDSLSNFLTHGAPLRARFARAAVPLSTLIHRNKPAKTNHTCRN